MAIPSADRPTFVWLSTIGHVRATVGTADSPALQVHLDDELGTPSLGASSEHAHDSRQILPALVGHIATLDGHRLEVADVIATHTTRPEATRWIGGDPIPTLHVQVRISRE